MKGKFPHILILLCVLGSLGTLLSAQDEDSWEPVPYLEIKRTGCLYEDIVCIPWERRGEELCLFPQSTLCWEKEAASSEEGCGEWAAWVEASSTVVLRSRECFKGRSRAVQWEPWPYFLVESEELPPLTPAQMATIRQMRRPLGEGLFWLEVPLPPWVKCREWGPWIEVRPSLIIRSQICVDEEFGGYWLRWEAAK